MYANWNLAVVIIKVGTYGIESCLTLAKTKNALLCGTNITTDKSIPKQVVENVLWILIIFFERSSICELMKEGGRHDNDEQRNLM